MNRPTTIQTAKFETSAAAWAFKKDLETQPDLCQWADPPTLLITRDATVYCITWCAFTD